MPSVDLPTPAHTHALGRWLAGHLQAGDVVTLSGQLGAGKTSLVRGVLEGLGGDPLNVTSPTFTLMNVYSADLMVYHVDAYRMERTGELAGLGFFELIQDGIGIVEWPERVAEAVAGPEVIRISLEHLPSGRRAIVAGIDGEIDAVWPSC